MNSEPSRYAIGDRFEIRIERIVPGGAGLGRGPNGAVLVDLSAPGDLLEIEIDSLRGGVARGRTLAILEPSPVRVAPPCPLYGRCGGCDLQHLGYDAQLDAKADIVRDALARIGGIRWAGEIARFAAPRPFGSRSRVELHGDAHANALGFFERRSRRIVDVESCIVAREEIGSAIVELRRRAGTRPASIRLLAGNGEVRSQPPVPPIEGEPFWLRIGEFDYRVDPAVFFQSSLDLLPDLVSYVVGSAGVDRGLAWDLFSGVGLFSLPLATTFDTVSAVEVDAPAVHNARIAASRNAIGNAHFAVDDVGRWLAYRRQRLIRPDLIVVDPPRTGLGTTVAKQLADKKPPRLTYVSCEPATLARDLRTLLSGELEIESLAIFDLFPQTHHVETVVRLVDRALR